MKRVRADIIAKGDDVAFAFTLLARMMRDDELPPKIRLDAAKEVLDRHLGKARAKVEITEAAPPVIDAEAVRRALADPRAIELMCELDRLVSRPVVDPGAD